MVNQMDYFMDKSSGRVVYYGHHGGGAWLLIQDALP